MIVGTSASAEFASDSLQQEPYLLFDLEQCSSYSSIQTNQDYSEFTAISIANNNCTGLSVGTVGHLYRSNPSVNVHSCTPGVNNSVAMCVGADPECTYNASSDRAVKFDIEVTPGPSGVGGISSLSFYEMAPDNFDWINGPSGANNNPTRYAIRVLLNGNVVYEESDIPTTEDWTLEEFDFSSNAAFTVDEPSVFNFELLAYCLAGNGAMLSVWDLDEIMIKGACDEVTGGVITTNDDLVVCADDGEDDFIDVTLSGNSGASSAWVITDDLGNILALPPAPPFNFEGAGAGTCLIWHLSFTGNIEGAEVGLNANDLEGCFSLSNPIPVERLTGADCIDCMVSGGVLMGGPFEFCVGDSVPDNIDAGAITLMGTMGANSQWVITDDLGNILGLPPTYEVVDFDGAPAGTCLVWHLSYDGVLEGAELGNNAADLVGCFSLSNPISVVRNSPVGGTLTGGPYEFCVGDGEADNIPAGDIVLTGNSGGNSQWVVTDDLGNILGLPPSYEVVDFDGAPAGTCLVWHLSYDGVLEGAEVGNNAADLEGCFSLSNPISVVRISPVGGMLTGGPYEFCVGDGEADNIPAGDIVLTGNSGSNSQWVVTDDLGNILGLPPSYEVVDFDGAPAGTCLVWHLSYEGMLEGAEVGNNAADLVGCFSLSNPISVVRNSPVGGTLTGGPYEFCVGDGEADNIPAGDIVLTGNSGGNSQWVVTDDLGNILGLPPSYEVVDFDGAPAGTCLVWHLSYDGVLEGAEVGNNAADLVGCFSLSNPISVVRNSPVGGTLTGGPYEFCVGDGEADNIPAGDIVLTGNSGGNSQWVVTDDLGNILGLPPSYEVVDFDGAPAGTCLVWHLSYDGVLEGAELGNNAADLVGCFSLSNPISVVRNSPVGGTLTGGPYEFCVGDGEADNIPAGDIVLTGNSGGNSQWVVTDDLGNILGLPPSYEVVDFDGAPAGTCLVWHLSYDGVLEGAEVGNNAADLVGCFSLSNPISVVRNSPVGGTLTGGPYEFCVGDGQADNIPAGDIVLTGNSGGNSQWVVTDDLGNILGLPPSYEVVDFDGAPAGTCLVWHLSYDGVLEGAELGNNAADLVGCFSLSNPISVVRNSPVGGTLTGGPYEFCVGDGEADNIPAGDIVLTGNSGGNSQWVVTDDLGNILGLPPSYEVVDFDGAPAGTCLVWHLSYDGVLEGAELGNNAADLVGCFSLSNPISVVRNSPVGGTLTGGPYEFCVGDGQADNIPAGDIVLTGNSGGNSQWVVTDDQGNILGLPPSYEVVDFDGAPAGTCLVWHLSYDGVLEGAELGNNAADLVGCFSLSNPIEVVRIDCNAPAGGIVINEFGTNDIFELKNTSNQTVDVSEYFICLFPAYARLSDLTIECGSLVLAPGELVSLVANFDINGNEGELGLYTLPQYSNANAIIDYVEWGFAGHQRASVAITAGIWSDNAFLPSFTDNENMLYDGDGDMVSDWSTGVASPCAENAAGPSPTSKLIFTVYPNPSSDMLNVDITSYREGTIRYQIVDGFGRVVLSEMIDPTNNHDSRIDITGLESGLYYLKLVNNNLIEFSSFVKL